MDLFQSESATTIRYWTRWTSIKAPPHHVIEYTGARVSASATVEAPAATTEATSAKEAPTVEPATAKRPCGARAREGPPACCWKPAPPM